MFKIKQSGAKIIIKLLYHSANIFSVIILCQIFLFFNNNKKYK